MKTAIHPQYYTDAVVVCACGHTFKTGSTKKEIRVEICSNCHPFYTGKSKLVDTTGRVERFQKVKQRSAELAATKAPKKPRKVRESKTGSK